MAISMTMRGTAQAPEPRATLEQRTLLSLKKRRRLTAGQVWTLRVASLVVVLGAWQLLVTFGVADELLVSKPSAIGAALFDYLVGGSIYVDILATTVAALLGLTIGTVLGIAIGVVLAKTPIFYRAVSPYVTILNAMPRPALAPIFLVWFGLGIESKVFVSMSIVVFILLLSTIAGIEAVDPDIGNLASSLAISPWRRFVMIELPTSLPFIVAALRLASVYAVLGVIVTEMVASYQGLGQQLVIATANFRMDRAFAVIFIAACIAVLLSGIVSLLERWLRRRWYQ